MKVSVVIPVYNVESYLKDCIESIERQTFQDFEILLYEDGSPDRCGKICDDLAEKYENIRVFHQENIGLVNTRNRGLSEATGDYVVFVDSDDFLKDESIFEKMVKTIEAEKADIVVGNYERLWRGKYLKAASHDAFSGFDRESEDFKQRGFFTVGTLAYAWGKMYRRSFLEKNQIYFEHRNYAEDKQFAFWCYLKGATYAFVPEIAYVYRKNDDSISYQFREDTVENWMAIAESVETYLLANQLEKHGDLVAYTIFFGAFFDGKMFYEEKGRRMSAVESVLKKYASYPEGKKYFSKMAGGKWIFKTRFGLWRLMIWGFSVGMYLHCYSVLALGIKLLVELKIDERLSDTGKRD